MLANWKELKGTSTVQVGICDKHRVTVLKWILHERDFHYRQREREKESVYRVYVVSCQNIWDRLQLARKTSTTTKQTNMIETLSSATHAAVSLMLFLDFFCLSFFGFF